MSTESARNNASMSWNISAPIARTYRPGLAVQGTCIVLFLMTASCSDARTYEPEPPDDQATAAAPQTPEPRPDGFPTIPEDAAYNPLTYAVASIGQVNNREAVIPPQCYTGTAGVANPCWTCHTTSGFPNFMSDWQLQEEYAFSEVGLRNHWSNLFADRSAAIAAMSDDEIAAYVRADNYTPLRQVLERATGYAGYVPDLDFWGGFDDAGFARDGSGWRGFRYKPFPGTFWPTNGSVDDVLIRLPETFRQGSDGLWSNFVYRTNLAILEAAMVSDPALPAEQLVWPIAAVSEAAVGRDLDGDGELGVAVELRGLPDRYLGGANNVNVVRGLYPLGTEFLHSVRYLDPDHPGFLARRMKELRYSRKVQYLDRWALLRAYEREHEEKDEGVLPVFTGSPLVGLRNEFGWQLQGFIEDADGLLRLQTEEEHLFCMGCHSTAGVTIDQTFAFPRKLPGPDGWGYQDLRGIRDVPQLGHAEPEILTYLSRVGGGDEFRGNTEMLARFFPDGKLDTAEVRRAAPGGDRDIRHLILPSPERAWLLNKAYRALVHEQRFDLGRDGLPGPATNVHRSIKNGTTALGKANMVYSDGRLRLAW